jgi:hypothetical protein
MTAGQQENAAAAVAMSQGEAAATKHMADALTVHEASGSAVTIEQPSTPDDHAVAWSPADSTAQPTLIPSEPRPVRGFDSPDAA